MPPSSTIAFLLIFSALRLAAQPASNSSSVRGPLVGFALDANSQVRPVLGVPGAASLGTAVPFDSNFQALAISPHQDYVLGFRSDTGSLILVADPLGAAQSTVISGVSGPGSITLSPTGAAAVVSLPGLTAVPILTGLPNSPAIAWQADLSALPAAASAFAVADDGSAILAAAGTGDHTSIFLITANAGARAVAAVGQLAGLSFVPGTTDALFGDSQSNQVQIVRDTTGAAALATIADASSGLSGPVDVAASENGSLVMIATSNPAGVLMVDRSAGTATQLTCGCSPTVLNRLNRSSVFRLTDSTAGLFWILDGNGPKQRILAIPPDAPPSAVAQ